MENSLGDCLYANDSILYGEEKKDECVSGYNKRPIDVIVLTVEIDRFFDTGIYLKST